MEKHGYRLFSVEHSIFSAKVRAYLRFKSSQGDLGSGTEGGFDHGFEDILATPHLINELLMVRSGSPSLPQLQTPDDDWVQDSSAIIDYLEQAHPKTNIIPELEKRPKQRLACYLIELLSDEWMIVPACWERWHYSRADVQPNHRHFNEQQWGAFLKPEGNGVQRREAGAGFFQRAFGIDNEAGNRKGPYQGLIELGCTSETQDAWQQTQQKLLHALETHLEQHDYILGGRPSLADFSLLGPVYVHFFRDPVAGFDLRTAYPLVSEWVERTNAENCTNARRFGQKLYKVDGQGELIGYESMSNNGAWLANDEVPDTVNLILNIFFEEMWPYLCESKSALSEFIGSNLHEVGNELPRKTFTATPGFESLQCGEGPLTVSFNIGGIKSRRMVVPYQMWMLQRIESAMKGCDKASLIPWLQNFEQGPEILSLNNQPGNYRVHKKGGLLYSSDTVSE
ncbi:MAG: glutathione S-transferase family protein [Pseudomonadales bacterium]|nr:glutathione S-transferase family protein [Pseudomonadales bacterium]MDG1444093.1 glutathione S-transferase family protein [Pseudomonadales bacterium]